MEQDYSQKWQAYDASQCREKTIFMPLLAELCKEVEQKDYIFGRPSLPISDMLFCTIMKVYSGRSLRRFMGDLKIAKEKGYIDKIPCFASIGHFLQRNGMRSILNEMIITSSIPLVSIETEFAIDSSGFTTSTFGRWFNIKYGKSTDIRQWIKAHLMCGVKTNIVTSVRISRATGNDCPYFAPLVKETAKNFYLDKVTADKAYSSRKNHEIVSKLGGTPFIPFRSNAKRRAARSSSWKKMYHYFMYNQEEFLKNYHKRSNVESTFHMIKSKFGKSLRSKTRTAQMNELLCKVLCHNLCVLIHEMHELNYKK